MANSSSGSTQVSGPHASRRQFFQKAGLAAGGLYALAAPSLVGPWLSTAEAADSRKRSFVAGRFALELDNAFCGVIASFEGGNFTADVVSVTQGTERTPRKSLGNPRIEPITVETPLEMTKPWYDWISRTMSGEIVRKNGAVIEMDQNFKEIGRRTFTNALISEIEFPACDGASKDHARMTVSIVPEQLKLEGGSGKQIPVAGGKKNWLVSNYRLNIQGLEQATQRATKIDAFAIKQKVILVQSGQSKITQVAPGLLEFPNLTVTVPDVHAGPLYAWLDDFLVKGNYKERPGVLEFLSADMRTPLAAVQLYGLGVFKISTEGSSGGQEKQRQTKVDIYCQKMTATFNP